MTLNYDIAVVEQRDETLYHLIYGRAGFDEHKDLAGLFQARCQFFQAVAADHVSALRSAGDKIVHLVSGTVKYSHGKAL